MIWAVLMLRPYVEGRRFTIRTDHESLRWNLNMADATGKLSRWRLRLQELEFDVVHREVIKHQTADALSRLGTQGEYQAELNYEVPVLLLESSETREATIQLFIACYAV